VPIRWVGRMVLDRLPTDFFAEVEQVAFCTQNIVPGIDFSNDPLLQGRNFSYLDTQLSRLGSVNFNQIPINRPLGPPAQNHQRDGHMQMTIDGSKLNYFPNRNSAKGVGPRPGNGGETQGNLHKPASAADAFVSSAAKVAGIKERVKAPKFLERVAQVRLFYNSQTAAEKAHICSAISFELSKVDDVGVRERMVALINEVDHALASAVAANAAIAAPSAPSTQNDGRQSKFLSMVTSPYSPPTTCATRKVAVLLADGYRAEELVTLKAALEKEGAVLVPVGVRRGKLFAEGETVVPPTQQPTADPINHKPDASGKTVEPPFTLVNSKSVLFDALLLIGGAASVTTLEKNGAAQAWIAETLKHCKAVGASSEAVKLLAYPAGIAGLQISAAGKEGKLTVDDGVVTVGSEADGAFGQAFVAELKKHRAWDRKNVDKLPA
jgi:catalase